jgi:Na+/melibiose symporter-like transporter
LTALRRLWLLPVCVAVAFLVSIPFSNDGSYSDNALVVLEVFFATFNVTVVLTVILLPGAALHTWLMHTVESRRASLLTRAVVALTTGLLMLGPLYLLPGEDDAGAWVFYAESVVLFACASVWYGSRLRRDP